MKQLRTVQQARFLKNEGTSKLVTITKKLYTKKHTKSFIFTDGSTSIPFGHPYLKQYIYSDRLNKVKLFSKTLNGLDLCDKQRRCSSANSRFKFFPHLGYHFDFLPERKVATTETNSKMVAKLKKKTKIGLHFLSACYARKNNLCIRLAESSISNNPNKKNKWWKLLMKRMV